MTESQDYFGDAHEIHMRLKQTIATMRAEGLTRDPRLQRHGSGI